MLTCSFSSCRARWCPWSYVKLENMIRDAYQNVKLADFAMACEVPPSGILEESVGSTHYAWPEVVYGVKYNGYQADSFRSETPGFNV